jgi:Domain of unknown function (DUF1906)
VAGLRPGRPSRGRGWKYVGRQRVSPRWAGALASCAAVAIVFVAVPSPSSFAAPAPPPGWKSVHYGPVSVSVPASWPVINLTGTNQCELLNTNAVYLGTQSPDAACPARAFGKSGSVDIQALASASGAFRARTPTTINGQRASVDPQSNVSHTMEAAFPQANALVSVSFGNGTSTGTSESTASRIEGSITTTSGTLATPTRSITGPGHRTVDQTSTGLLTSFDRGVTDSTQAVAPTIGYGFDTCTAPSLADMDAWLSSPYRTVGVYIGGANEACAQPNLTPAWVSDVEDQGWSLIPIYVGLQAPCVEQSGLASIDSSDASAEGTAAAEDAATDAQGVGLAKGSPIFFDMEAYGDGCSSTVTTFLSSWNYELGLLGYTSGIYESTSNVGDLVNDPPAQPDILWFAQWDDIATTSNAYVPSYLWTDNQRIKQYEGGHVESYDGVALDIDSDYVDAVLDGPTTSAGPGSQSSSVVDDPQAEQIQVYGIGGNRAVYEKVYSYVSNQWVGWIDLGGDVTSGNPVAVYDAQVAQLQVYVVGPSSAVWEDVYSYLSDRWSGWYEVGGEVVRGNPQVIDIPETQQVQVYVVGPGYAVYQDVYSYTAGRWSGWSGPGGWVVSGSPNIVYDPLTDEVQVYVVGPSSSVWEAVYDVGSNQWSSWYDLGGEVTSGVPDTFYDAEANEVQVYVVGPGNAVYQDIFSYTAGQWSGWSGPGGWVTGGSPSVVYDPDVNQAQVYVVGPSSSVWEAVFGTTSGQWSSWYDLGGEVTSGSAVTLYDPEVDQVQVYVVGPGSSVWEDVYSYLSNRWSGWLSLGGIVGGFSP